MGLTENIRNGKYDAALDRIIRACQDRKEQRIYELPIGAKVKFGPTTRPDYLRGATATIIQWRRTRVLIQLDQSQYLGRFQRGGGRIIAHASSLLPVEVVKNDPPEA